MSYEKIVKLACKPKNAPPKAKYLDQIIAATYQEDGAVSDVCRAIAPRLREPNAVIVFKALIVLHTMIRTGNTENVLNFLATGDSLRLGGVSGGHWEGYRAPEHLGDYAGYIQARINAFRELKHDVIRVETESNRDYRVNVLEGDREFGDGRGGGSGISRSKTIVGRKLRVMTVEKGLLRETKIVQSIVETVISTKFYLDNLEEELNVTALRMLVKDLLILFQAMNQGVINVLEHYLEMSHVDATDALAIYRKFCRQTEQVVEYLSIAKKLQNLLNVSIPNLKHAPVQLASSLEEVLNDPNFEDNRLQYKANKTDGKPSRSKTENVASVPPVPKVPESSLSPTASAPTPAPSAATNADPQQAVQDFFSSIEREQGTMFNPNTNSPTASYFQQQRTANPFVHRQSVFLAGQPAESAGAFIHPQTTNFPGAAPQGSFQVQATGAFIHPQFTAAPQSAFLSPQTQPTNAFLQPQGPTSPSPAFLQPQSTAFLQPQPTGSNPFRQSMLFSQATGIPAFNGIISTPQPQPTPFSSAALNPFPRPGSAAAFASGPSRSTTLPPLQEVPSPSQEPSYTASPTSPFARAHVFGGTIQRPASTPIRSSASANGSTISGGIVTHTTGSRNPFGVPQPVVPPVPELPKAPTLQQLATGAGWSTTIPSSDSTSSSGGGDQGKLQMQPTGNGLMGSLASSFLTSSPANPSLPSTMALSDGVKNASSSPFGSSYTASAVSSQPTSSSAWSSSTFNGSGAFSTASGPGSTTASSAPSTAPLQAQPTGFGGSSVRPFKPSSSFGANLLESISSVGENSEPGTPSGGSSGVVGFGANGSTNGQAGVNLGGQFARVGAGAQPTTGSFLRPQTTGGSNPFRASMAFGSAPTPSAMPAPNSSTSMGASLFGVSNPSNTTPFVPGQQTSQQQLASFAGFGGPFGSSAFGIGGEPSSSSVPGNQPRQNGASLSLI